VIIGLGGGSPIGTAKAAVARLAGGAMSSDTPWLVAAIPTTYSGSEVTPVFGTTDFARGRKEVVRNPGIRPRLVLYDPELAIDTPPDLTAGTGINALAHCVEGLYSNARGYAERAMAVGARVRVESRGFTEDRRSCLPSRDGLHSSVPATTPPPGTRDSEGRLARRCRRRAPKSVGPPQPASPA